MTEIDDAARDEVLFAFQLAHPRPAPADVARWADRHPGLRADIMEHAAFLIEMDQGGEADEPVPEDMLLRGRSVTTQLMHRSREAESRVAGVSTAASLGDLLSSSGKSVAALSSELDAGRGMLTDYVSGRMSAPIRMRLRTAVSKALGVAVATLDAALEATLAAPLGARAKANGVPVVRVRSYDECVATDATMSNERRAYWLAED